MQRFVEFFPPREWGPVEDSCSCGVTGPDLVLKGDLWQHQDGYRLRESRHRKRRICLRGLAVGEWREAICFEG